MRAPRLGGFSLRNFLVEQLATAGEGIEIGGQAVVRDQPGSVLLPALPQRHGFHFSGGDEFVGLAPADPEILRDVFGAEPFGAWGGFHEAQSYDIGNMGLEILPPGVFANTPFFVKIRHQ